mmetsp:Transcript_128523/g.305031  ORF Transcript_128523/g.305031 Transcript_128523/m.305031 type:complete len:268 (+) Transcript_128523:1496-2299(+)
MTPHLPPHRYWMPSILRVEDQEGRLVDGHIASRSMSHWMAHCNGVHQLRTLQSTVQSAASSLTRANQAGDRLPSQGAHEVRNQRPRIRANALAISRGATVTRTVDGHLEIALWHVSGTCAGLHSHIHDQLVPEVRAIVRPRSMDIQDQGILGVPQAAGEHIAEVRGLDPNAAPIQRGVVILHVGEHGIRLELRGNGCCLRLQQHTPGRGSVLQRAKSDISFVRRRADAREHLSLRFAAQRALHEASQRGIAVRDAFRSLCQCPYNTA